MNYPRVNLIKKNELRYQGAVSSRFILVSVVAAPILIIALVSGLKMIQYNRVQSALQTNRELWSDLEPQYKDYQEEQKSLSKGKEMLNMFDGWRQSKISLYGLMNEIQQTVPETIQLSRLSIRSKATTASFTVPEDMLLKYNLVMEGRSVGDLSEQHVYGLRKDLIDDCQNVGDTFDSLELAYMRKRENGVGESHQEFKIEGKTEEGTKL